MKIFIHKAPPKEIKFPQVGEMFNFNASSDVYIRISNEYGHRAVFGNTPINPDNAYVYCLTTNSFSFFRMNLKVPQSFIILKQKNRWEVEPV